MDLLLRVSNKLLLVLVVLLNPLWSGAQQDLHYNLRADVRPVAKTFSVDGTLSFRLASGTTDSVAITLSPCVGRPYIRLQQPALSIAAVDTATNGMGDIVYWFRLGKQLKPGTRLEFAYRYERGAAPAFQYYLDSTFCMAGGYGAAWYPHVALPAADGTLKALRGTARIRVTLPQPFVAVMAAAMTQTTIHGQSATYAFTYATPDIFSLYIGAYRRQEVSGPVPFYYFGLGNNVDVTALSARASAVLCYLVTLFGPLSIPNFSIIEFPDVVSERMGIGGASIMGGIVMPASAMKRFNYALFGHELSHQWWGNKVLARGQKGVQLLSEGLAQYGSLQVVQHFDSARALLYRKTGYPGYIPDQCGFGYLKYTAAGIDAPLSQLDDANGHTIGASKGFLALELLSNTIGKAKFHKALQHMADQYSAAGLSWEDFLRGLETVHGGSLQEFYRQWFDRNGAPAWHTTWQQHNDTLQLTIRQTDTVYSLPLEVLITYAHGQSVLQYIQIQEREAQIQLPVSGAVATVQVDPFFKVLHWDEALAAKARELSKAQRVQQLRIEQKMEAAEILAQSYLQAGFPEDHYGTEFTILYTLGRIKGARGKEDEALAHYLQALRCAVRSVDLLAYTYYRVAQLARHKNDPVLFRWACEQALKADALNNANDDMETMIRQLQAAPGLPAD